MYTYYTHTAVDSLNLFRKVFFYFFFVGAVVVTLITLGFNEHWYCNMVHNTLTSTLFNKPELLRVVIIIL